MAEEATGMALLIAPSLVGRLLLGAELAGASIPVARVTGTSAHGSGPSRTRGSGYKVRRVFDGNKRSGNSTCAFDA